MFFSLLNSVGSTRTSLVAYFIPLVGVILGILFMGEKPQLGIILWRIMIVGGVLWVNYGTRLVKLTRLDIIR